MTNKEIDKILNRYTKEVKRHIDVLKEDFDSKVQLIAEQHDSIQRTLDSHSKILQSHSQLLEHHSQLLEHHSQILDSHTEMIASMKEDIEIMKVDISFIKNSLKQKVDVEEFQALERRVALLEAKISSKRK
ncbi:MAG: hypothetical protein LR000_00830 [Candidatus Pacebacteria bacterium]|nr:hypothetical protein [Candidatus Paceibacterota bacterium]